MPATLHPLRPADIRGPQLHAVDACWREFVSEAPAGCRAEYEAEANQLHLIAEDLVGLLNRASKLSASRDRKVGLLRTGDCVAEAFAEALTPEAARLLVALFVSERGKL